MLMHLEGGQTYENTNSSIDWVLYGLCSASHGTSCSASSYLTCIGSGRQFNGHFIARERAAIYFQLNRRD
jgi:hypothetical protein